MKLFKQRETYISEGIKFTGDIEANVDVIIDGEMFGHIQSTKHVMLGAASRFEGDIESDSAVVCGYVRGSIVTKQFLEVKKPANIMGDLRSALVRLDSGVVIQGKVLSKPQEQKGLLSTVAVAVVERESEVEAEAETESIGE